MHRIAYLNDPGADAPLFENRLTALLRESKQARAPRSQWLSFVRSLTQKGVKQAELEESELLRSLETDSREALTREEVLTLAKQRLVVVKEVGLDKPRYSSYRQPGGQYEEILYIAKSEAGMVDDALEAVEDEMASLAMDMERVMEDPDLPVRLERRRMHLLDQRGSAVDFARHHYSGEMSGELGKNLLAHARTIFYPETGLFFIQEIQSDWAQRGRRDDWRTIPRIPMISTTEAWAGMVLRRLMQKAALQPAVRRVAWMTESMRNGGTQDLQREANALEAKKLSAQRAAEELERLQAAWRNPETRLMMPVPRALDVNDETAVDQWLRQQAEATAQQGLPQHLAMAAHGDGLNEFYLRTLPKLAERSLKGTSAQIAKLPAQLADRHVVIPGFDMTSDVRERLRGIQPVYSRDELYSRQTRIAPGPDQLGRLLQRARLLTGSPHRLRLALAVFDAGGSRVAGKYADGLIHVSMRAKRLDEVLDHEAFHFAQDRLLSRRELALLDDAFAPGAPLNKRVVSHLRARGSGDQAEACSTDRRECAAQAFALWVHGFALDPAPTSVFRSIQETFRDVMRWVQGQRAQSRLERRISCIFTAFDRGLLAPHGTQTAAPSTHAAPPLGAAQPADHDHDAQHHAPAQRG